MDDVHAARGLTKATGQRLPSCDADQMGVERMESLPAGLQNSLRPREVIAENEADEQQKCIRYNDLLASAVILPQHGAHGHQRRPAERCSGRRKLARSGVFGWRGTPRMAGIPRSSDSSGGAKRRLGARLAAAFRRLRACRTASNTNPDTIQYQIMKRCDILSRSCRSAKSAATAAIARSSLASRVMGRNSTQPVANHPKNAKTRQADRRIINHLQTA